MFVGSFGYTWGPYFFNEVKMDREGFKILFPKIAKVWIFLVILLALACSVFSKEMILLFTTTQFLKTYKIVPIFYIGYLFAFVYNFPNAVLLFEKKTKILPFIGIASAFVTVILNFLLIPKFGLLGAAFVHLISTAIICILGIICAQKYYKLNYNLKSMLLIFVLACIIGFYLYDLPVNFYYILQKLFLILFFVSMGLIFIKNDLKAFLKKVPLIKG
jgi:O-antigen/teichoic acid export membrane protein